jgi:hypothetical protein
LFHYFISRLFNFNSYLVGLKEIVVSFLLKESEKLMFLYKIFSIYYNITILRTLNVFDKIINFNLNNLVLNVKIINNILSKVNFFNNKLS